MTRKYTVIRKRFLRGHYVCEDCSVIVKDPDQHQDWHSRLVDAIKLAI